MIKSIAELPFYRRELRSLFGIRDDLSGEIDTDFTGFGWGLVPHLELASLHSGFTLHNPLVLALHALDLEEGERPEAEADCDFELCFELEEQSVVVSLRQFLHEWLPRLPLQAEVVLAVCNPFHVPLPYAPQLPPGTALFVPSGNVDCYEEKLPEGTRYILEAEHWQVLHASQ